MITIKKPEPFILYCRLCEGAAAHELKFIPNDEQGTTINLCHTCLIELEVEIAANKLKSETAITAETGGPHI